MAVRPETAELLRQLYDDLRQPDPYPEHASEAEQDAWMDQESADGWLAGLLSRATAQGRVTRAEVEQGRALTAAAGSRVGRERVAEAYALLLRESL